MGERSKSFPAMEGILGQRDRVIMFTSICFAKWIVVQILLLQTLEQHAFIRVTSSVTAWVVSRIWVLFYPITGQNSVVVCQLSPLEFTLLPALQFGGPAHFFPGKATQIILKSLLFPFELSHVSWSGSSLCGFLIPLLAGMVPAPIFIWWWQYFEYSLLTKMKGLCRTFLIIPLDQLLEYC